MSLWTVIKKSLLFYRKNHTGVILGVALGTAILVGAFILGDSVRYSLRQLVYTRLGRTEYALQTGDRFFRVELADRLSTELNTTVAAALQTKGIAVSGGGEYRANKIQILGVDGRFGTIGGEEQLYSTLGANEVLLNNHLAGRLHVSRGDEILLRIEKLDAMPRDAPLALDSDLYVTRRFVVRDVVSDEQFGRFGLRTNQVAPLNVFLPLAELNKLLELEGKANLMLVAQGKELSHEKMNQALDKHFGIADAGLKLVELEEGSVELRSDRVFLEPAVSHLARLENSQPVFTYFVNELRKGERATPYSFVSALSPSLVKPELGGNEMAINTWLARDLAAGIGDSLEVTYYVVGPSRSLREERKKFVVKKIVPISGPTGDRSLMPDFPGLADQENCRDWEAGIPIDYDRIRDKDEKYWDDYRGTPKAFVSLETAQALWSNRYGNLTAIRYPGRNAGEIEAQLGQRLKPRDVGYYFQPVLRQGLAASQQSVDFAGLFLGLSFFIIVSALLLMGLLFAFGIEERSSETGLYLALGYPVKLVKKLILGEGALIAFVGAFIGLFLGIGYDLLVLAALKSVWQDIVGTSALQIYINPISALAGTVIAVLLSLATMWLTLRKQSKSAVSYLQRGLAAIQTSVIKRPLLMWLLTLLSFVGVVVILLTTSSGRGKEASAAFFTAGTLLLIGGLSALNLILARRAKTSSALSGARIALSNMARRKNRSLSLIGLLASGLFIVFTVGANRHSAVEDARLRSSGTGGFALFGESTIPVLYDLNSPRGQDFYSLDESLMRNVSIVQFKVREGDDASCLNLNRSANPQLIGVDPAALDQRGAFTFAKLADGVDPEHPWKGLEYKPGDDVVPGVADQTVIVWGLGKSVGDTLYYVDENGNELKVRLVGGLANSVFQGNVIISERAFVEKFPSISGFRMFLVDASPAAADSVAKELSFSLADQGLDLTPAHQRLAEFNKVENTYLSIFLILGGLGMIIGTLGLGIVVLRNVNERRGELALLRAVGYQKEDLMRMILAEHAVLLLAGVGLGILSALFAMLPALSTPGTDVPVATIVFTLACVLISGIAFTWLATRLALKGELLSALRNE